MSLINVDWCFWLGGSAHSLTFSYNLLKMSLWMYDLSINGALNWINFKWRVAKYGDPYSEFVLFF